MEELHEQTLAKNRKFLCDNLDLDEIRDELVWEEVMPIYEWERIDAKVTTKDKVGYFLNTYPRCGPAAYGVLLAILNDIPERQYITKELNNTFQGLIAEGDSLKNTGFRQNSQDIYPSGPIRLLIAYYDFKGTSKERKGCKEDVDKMRETFKDFDVDITTLANLEKEELETAIDKFVKDDKSRNAAACIFVVSSHGGENDVICCNKGSVSRDSLIKRFGRDSAQSLQAKPKLMMFQCCRGVAADDGEKKHQLYQKPAQASDPYCESGDVDQPSNKPGTPVSKDESDAKSVPADRGHKGETGAGPDPEKSTEACHNNADMLVVSASSEGEVALRDESQGSLMIQRFCDLVGSSWRNEHVADIFTKVTNILGEGFYLQDGRQVIPQVTIENTLRRKWYIRQK